MGAFNSRFRPQVKFGLPVALFNFGSPAIIILGFSLFCPAIVRELLILLGLVCLVLAIHGTIHHKNMLFLKALRSSKKERKARLSLSLLKY